MLVYRRGFIGTKEFRKTFQIFILQRRKMSSFATADLCDGHVASPGRLEVARPNYLNDYGGRKSFWGEIETIRCFESNPLVRKTLSEPGNGRVLVVDGGSSTRVAIMGDMLARFAKDNEWAGVIINGCIRDSKVISGIDIGVKAIGTHPGRAKYRKYIIYE